MNSRPTVLALAFACVPALAAAQSAGPLAAPALSRYDAPPLWAMETSARPDASLLPASMGVARMQEPLPRSRIYYSLPASAALGVAGFAGGYGTGMASGGLSVGAAVVTDHFVRRPR